jgi:hypothetical protein
VGKWNLAKSERHQLVKDWKVMVGAIDIPAWRGNAETASNWQLACDITQKASHN